MAGDSRKRSIAFNPRDRAWSGKLWVRLNTSDDPKIFFIWSRVGWAAAILIVAGWLGLAGAAWAFVKYQRGVSDADFIDLAFYPLRHEHYRATLGRHAYAQAQAALERGDAGQALMELRSALGKLPHHLEVRHDLAALYQQFGRPDAAIEVIETGLAQADDDLDYANFYLQLLEANQRDRAIATFGAETLPETPDGAPFHREVARQTARAMARLGEYQAARALIDHWDLHRTTPGQIDLAVMEIAEGKRLAAIDRLEQLLGAHPETEFAALLLVQAYRAEGRLDAARRIAIRRVLLKPDSPGARADLIGLLSETGEHAASARERDDYLERFQDDERALQLLLQTASQVKDPELARRTLAAAPTDPEGRQPPLLTLACMQAECEAGAYAAALQTGDRLQGHPNLSTGAQARLGMLRAWASFSLNRTTAAQTWLNQLFTFQGPAFEANAVLLAPNLAAMGLREETRRLRLALVERAPENAGYLIQLVTDDLEQQSWEHVRSRLPALLALETKPAALLRRLVLVEHYLNLSPDLIQRLRLAAGQVTQ